MRLPRLPRHLEAQGRCGVEQVVAVHVARQSEGHSQPCGAASEISRIPRGGSTLEGEVVSFDDAPGTEQDRGGLASGAGDDIRAPMDADGLPFRT